MSNKKYLESESLKEAMWKRFYAEEDKWERTPEADFLDVHGGCPRHWFQLGFSVGLDAVVKADPVPQEMSAREFVATISDMCINQFPEGCAPCPLWVAGHGCGEKILPLEKAVAIVEAWAREHPEERSEDTRGTRSIEA